MKTWPKKFTLQLVRQFLLITIALVGMSTIVKNFLFYETQTREDVVDSIILGFIMSSIFIFLDWEKWKTYLRKYLEKEDMTMEIK